MTNTNPQIARFKVSKFAGKFVAQMFISAKVEGYPFGAFGVSAHNLGRFPTFEQAKACLEAKRRAVCKAA